MTPSRGRSVSLALIKLRLAVLWCCWIAAGAVLVHVIIWSVSMFTDIRFAELKDQSGEAPLVVKTDDQSGKLRTTQQAQIAGRVETVDANRVKSKYDSMMATLSALANGFGALAMIVLLPSIVLGVMIGAGNTVIGVERCVSAFCWALALCVLVMPVGTALHLPWADGALCDYQAMVEAVDQARHVAATDDNAPPSFRLYARYLVLPVACIAGLILVGGRFSGGVETGLITRHEMMLDPELEREAANVKASSLHGSRAAAALRNVVPSDDDENPAVEPKHAEPEKELPSARAVSPGDRPRRII